MKISTREKFLAILTQIHVCNDLNQDVPKILFPGSLLLCQLDPSYRWCRCLTSDGDLQMVPAWKICPRGIPYFAWRFYLWRGRRRTEKSGKGS